jgi:diacylglycerol kinase family enzyme
MTNLETFGALLHRICAHSLAAPGRSLRWTIIANPHAGGFTIFARWKKHRAALDAAVEKAEALPARPGRPSLSAGKFGKDGFTASCGLTLTAGPGHAEKITAALVEEIQAGLDSGDPPFHLIITAGGDGTSLEVQQVLFYAPPAVRSSCVVLRLPLGTGNDGADDMELGRALELLLSPSRTEFAGALRLNTAVPGKGPFLAFNILSVGLDAFVTHMTNKMKSNLPGDSYKFWVDIAALFYDKIYRVGPMEIRTFDRGGRQQRSFRQDVLLLAVGVSGRRTYGARKMILPDDRNVCVLRQMPLYRKIALKELFNTGGHIDKPEALLFNAEKIEFRGEYPVLAQMDGETLALGKEDFPASIELTEKLIPVLKRRES